MHLTQDTKMHILPASLYFALRDAVEVYPMAFWEKTKRWLDWLQHGYMLVQILGSGAVATGLKAMLLTYTHIPPIWITPIWLGASAVVFALFVYVGNRYQRRDIAADVPVKPTPLSPKLLIHSAFYGTGEFDDQEVTERLQAAARDAMVIPVNNNFLGCDPAPNRPKRLRVEYSYGTPAKFEISRPEHSRIVLPEDVAASGVANTVDTTTDVMRDVLTFLKKQGPEPKPKPGELVYEGSEARTHAVHSGFALRVHPRVEKLIYQLGEAGIFDYELNGLVNRPAHSEKSIRQIAERLTLLRDKLEQKEYGPSAA